MLDDRLQIPACQRCRARKIKCDHAAPKCAACTKSSTACIILDPISQAQYTRQSIQDLESKEKELSEQLRRCRSSVQVEGPRTHESNTTNAEGSVSVASTTKYGGYVGESSGLHLLRTVLADADWWTRRPRESEETPPIPEHTTKAHPLPSPDEALALLENYYNRFHINHTFLVREDVMEVFNTVYGYGGHSQSPSQDLFRLFMIFAISGVTRYRAGSPDAIQNSLLMARFGMYQHIGTSLWDISQFCMRQCIELGYHAPPRSPVTAIEEQKQRRIFWECYMVDRHSSGILGRPYAIADEDISVELPILADDEALKAANVHSLSALEGISPTQPTEVSVFVFVIRLRQISSRIHTEFFNGSKNRSQGALSTPVHYTSAGHVQSKVHEFSNQLDAWRQTAPVFLAPKSLYERSEFYDFLLEKDRLDVARGAMQSAPKMSNNSPPPELLDASRRTAVRVIELFADMLEKAYITWTRGYFQSMFTAGLSILYCISLDSANKRGASVTDTERSSTAALQLCSQVLHSFEKEMPDVRSFAVVFDELKDLVVRKSQGIMGNATGNTTSNATEADAPHERSAAAELPSGTTWQGTEHASLQNLNGSLDFGDPFAGGDPLSTSNFDALQGSQMGVDWPTMTEEFMHSLEAGVGEYAWGFAGDEMGFLYQPDSM